MKLFNTVIDNLFDSNWWDNHSILFGILVMSVLVLLGIVITGDVPTSLKDLGFG